MAKKVTGGCACGSIRYQLLDKPMFVHCCHCDDCQRLTGSAFVLNAIIETQAIKLLRGKPVAVPVPRENGPHDIYRCPRCQTALWSNYGRRPNLRFVRVGTFDRPGALKPDVHIYTGWKAKWLKLPKSHKIRTRCSHGAVRRPERAARLRKCRRPTGAWLQHL
jgi:hypothetical protein